MTIKQIKDLLQKQAIKKILENLFSLSFLQIANYIIPLITLPYLVRVLGPEKFGLTAFAQAFILYFIFLVDFGFNISATREISIHRNDINKVSEIFSSVFFIKFFLLILSFLIFIVIVSVVSTFKVEMFFYLLNFLTVVGWIIFPQWYFQGIEKMKFIALVNFLAKFILTIAIIIFIREVDDYIKIPILNFVGLLISGIVSLVIVYKYYPVKIKLPRISIIKVQFNLGLQIFVSNVGMNLYTTSNSVVLGLLTNNVIVGYYTAAEKIFKAFQYLSIPINQAVFPHFSQLIAQNKTRAIQLFNKFFWMSLLFTSIVSLVMVIASPLVKIFLGIEFVPSILIFSILSIGLIPSLGNYTLGIQGLVNFGHEKVFAKIVFICGLIHIFLLVILIKSFGYLAVPILWIFTETVILMIMFRYLKKLNIIKIGWNK